jgi:two-component system OmpR family sensor kinase
VGDIIEAAVAAVRPMAEHRGVVLAVQPSPELLVNAAPVATEVALANILDNAVKFSPKGGELRVVVTAEPDEAVIAVSDAGPGVETTEVPRLFQRFYRGHASRGTDAPGVGLGLAIAQALVERQGGRISVEAHAKGATFSVRLPRA